MSKIHKAISKAKVSRDSSVRSGALAVGDQTRSLGRRTGDHTPSATPPLANIATEVPLDKNAIEKNRVVTVSQTSGAATSYKMLRTRMLHQMKPNDWSRIAVCSARRNAGKTLTAVNTAISLSSEPNQQVILVDLDLRRPMVAKTLGIHHKAGLSDYLENKAGIEDIVVRTEIERLMIIPNYGRIEDSSESLSSSRMRELVEVVSSKGNSSIVLFDLPPILEADDLLAFSPLADALLVVVAEGETRRADLQKSTDLLQEMNILGFVLNKSRGDDYVAGYYY